VWPGFRNLQPAFDLEEDKESDQDEDNEERLEEKHEHSKGKPEDNHGESGDEEKYSPFQHEIHLYGESENSGKSLELPLNYFYQYIHF
jgi:hypothetical protein